MELDTNGNDALLNQTTLLKKLKEVWRTHPDFRFGTFIMDMADWDPNYLTYATNADIMYMLDNFDNRG